MSIRYDQHVKKPLSEFEYNLEHITELSKCSKDISYFIKYVKIIHPDKGEISFEPFKYQKKLLKKFQKYRYNIALCSRQSGKTTIVGVYALHYAIFSNDKTIAIVSNKESSAKMILARIKRIYESLPFWLKPGIKAYNKTSVEFDNGTHIIVSATSPDALRGRTVNLLICDEFAFVPKNQAEEFWASNYPTISASEDAKIIIISTPNGMYNLFHKLYIQSEQNANLFKYTKVSWQEVPGRDKKWAEDQKKNLTKEQFAQEFAVEFLGSVSTVIDTELLKELLLLNISPITQEFNGLLRIYETPKQNGKYVLGVDTAKGTGEHYSTIQVLRLDSVNPIKLEQVAVYQNNTIDVYLFAELVFKLACYYNNGYIMVENNSEGAVIVTQIWWEYEYPNLVNTGEKTTQLGIRATKNSKPKAVILMKKLIENKNLILNDKNTIEELTSFINKGGKFFGLNKPDDLVSALYWACFIFEFQIFEESYKFDSIKENDDNDCWGILSDIDKTLDDDWSWVTM